MPGNSTKPLIRRAEALHRQCALVFANRLQLTPSDVHCLRVSIKELRALWQVLKPFMAKGQADTASREIGRAAKQLAKARDQHVQLKTLDKRIRKAQGAELASLRCARDQLAAQQPEVPEQALLKAEIVSGFIHDRQRWHDLKLSCGKRELMHDGYGRLYRKARKCFHRAAASGNNAEDWHRLRRWVKYLALALPVLADDNKARALAGRYARLARQLGDLNDLDVLATSLKQLPDKNDMSTYQAIALVEQRADVLQSKCHKKSRRLFGQKK
ncbi:CHAD domain-containing protein [Halopseudomonas salegens]|uniref:CHAD domain-containing protein n=1 Tax=Halopseudomonas salegens TaxID=1434072 RepID=A0A1H2E8D0_9GAMM|nr:CHAD domain-containing protein [Halopseudomonas salegens]SDT91357.1 CHAD domain-containing protein [Halopseudomonas salegens]